jgi:glycosyltransferase involved in cell wall biosynthesis
LIEQGIDSEVWVGFKFSKNPLVRSFSSGTIERAKTALGILMERYISSSFTKKLKIPFSVPVWGRNIAKHKALESADIIHIHWVNHGFLRPEDVRKLARLEKPIVWTFHDSNTFTGGCHVRYGCNHFENECGNCPLLKVSNPNDRSHKTWLAKSKAYTDLNFSVVAPSRWMKASATRSSLVGSREIINIPNTLDTSVFKPTTKIAAREKLGLSPDKFIVLSGFMPSRNDLHKGTPYLLEALELLAKKIPQENIELVVFGNRTSKKLPEFAIKTTFLGTISGDEKLALCYSAADVFVTPSLEDNLPNTVMESLSCGTPVVAFTTGGIPDMVGHKQNGYLAGYKSSAELAEGIEWMYVHPQRNELKENARISVMKNFSEPVIASRHIELYKELLKRI